MKYFVVVFFALAVAVPLSSTCSTGTSTSSCLSTCSQNNLGDILANYILACVTNVVQFLIDILLQLVSGYQTVPIADLLPQLQALGKNPPLGQILDTLIAELNLPIGNIVNALPCAILNTPICVTQLVAALAPALTDCGGNPTLDVVLQLGANFVSSKIATDLQGYLDAATAL